MNILARDKKGTGLPSPLQRGVLILARRRAAAKALYVFCPAVQGVAVAVIKKLSVILTFISPYLWTASRWVYRDTM